MLDTYEDLIKMGNLMNNEMYLSIYQINMYQNW